MDTDCKADLASVFRQMPMENRLSVFFDIDDGTDGAEIAEFAAECKRLGAGRLIPRFRLPPDGGIARRLRLFSVIAAEAKKHGLKIGLDLSCFSAAAGGGRNLDADDAGACCRLIETREYACTELEDLRLMIHPGKLLAIVALEEEGSEPLDLRPFVSDDTLVWRVPRGNWTVIQYLCRSDYDSPHVDYLSYRAAYDEIEALCQPYLALSSARPAGVLDCLFYHDVQYVTQNRRMWAEDFNEAFAAAFGFDPSPYYPALFRWIGKNTPHYKALFFDCRAGLLQSGFLKAVADFCRRHGLMCVGTPSGAKFPACSFLHGDGMMVFRHATAPCAQMGGAYLYGTNSLKIAAGAALGKGCGTVAAEMFDGYKNASPALLYREMILSYAKGVNHVFAHLPAPGGPATLAERLRAAFAGGAGAGFMEPAARTQALLSGGHPVCDVALIYPIYALHAEVYLYEDRRPAEYEFPSTPETADYMNVINTVTDYVGLDLAVLHPEVIKARGRVEDGRLVLQLPDGEAAYQVVILPAGRLVGIDTLRLLRQFYDEGGKIIATGQLPTGAFEFGGGVDYDEEVVQTILHIFGTECFNTGSFKKYCENRNGRGGQAYFFYSCMSALDGTYMVSGDLLEKAFVSFGLSYDVVLINPPHRETVGFLNIPLYEYRQMEPYYRLSEAGTLIYVHKRRQGRDLYYFANSSVEPYRGEVLLRGHMDLELWDPQTGEVKELPCVRTVAGGVPYTKFFLELPPASALFAVSV